MRGACGFLAAMLAAALTSCGKAPDPPQPKPAPQPVVAEVAKPEPRPPAWPECIAQVEGMTETPVLARQAGYLVKQLFSDGDIVAAGDLLFLIDPLDAHSESQAGKPDDLVKITAPIGGAMGRPLHGLGDRLDAGGKLGVVASIDPIRAVFSIPLAVGASRPASQGFELIFENGSVYPVRGKLDSITVAGTKIGVCVVFPNPKRVLRPGQFVKVRGVP